MNMEQFVVWDLAKETKVLGGGGETAPVPLSFSYSVAASMWTARYRDIEICKALCAESEHDRKKRGKAEILTDIFFMFLWISPLATFAVFVGYYWLNSIFMKKILRTLSHHFFLLALQPPWAWPLIFQFYDHFTEGRTRWTSDQLVAKPLPKHTQNKHIHIPNIHALCGIRTQDPGFRASEDSTYPRPLCYRDRLRHSYSLVFIFRMYMRK
jgi:hypothetical protein